MKPGDLIRLNPQFFSINFYDDESVQHDGTVVHGDELMLFLGEDIIRMQTYARIFHPSKQRIGYVRTYAITVVNHETG